MRRIKHKGTGKEGTDANQLHLALCSISTQRTFSVRILHNPRRSNIMVGVVHLANLFQYGGFQNGHWHINQNYQLQKCLDHELDEEFNGKTIPEGAVVSVEIDDKRRSLNFKVNGEEAYGNVKTGLDPAKFARLVGAVYVFWKDDEVEIIDSE